MANSVAENYLHQSTNKYTGIRSWLLTTDHKKIGLLYFVGILFFFLVGAVIGL